MNISLLFLRVLFLILSIFFMTTFMVTTATGTPLQNTLFGIGLGVAFGALLIGFDMLFRRFNLRSFNIAIIGIFFGYLMGQALVLILDAVMDLSHIKTALDTQTTDLIKVALFLFGIYLGTILTLRSADEIYVSIPFVKFAPSVQKKKDLIVDASVLLDTRVIDVAATGLLDHQLVIPRFIIKDLHMQAETGDENSKAKAKRCLDTIKRLESISHLELRFHDTDFPDVKETFNKLIRLSRLLDGYILTADLSRLQMSVVEDIKVINIHALSNALKPLMQAGESIRIKIQRFGKEPNQGVGYLEDGTMVVVNGGGDYIGETIEAQVLSVKHTSSGRMIFCNAPDVTEPYRKPAYDEQS